MLLARSQSGCPGSNLHYRLRVRARSSLPSCPCSRNIRTPDDSRHLINRISTYKSFLELRPCRVLPPDDVYSGNVDQNRFVISVHPRQVTRRELIHFGSVAGANLRRLYGQGIVKPLSSRASVLQRFALAKTALGKDDSGLQASTFFPFRFRLSLC